MSRKIDKTKLDEASQEDLEYLRDHGELTPEQRQQYLGDAEVTPPQAPDINTVPNTGDVDTAPKTSVGGEGGGAERITGDYQDYERGDLLAEAQRRGYEELPARISKSKLVDLLEEDDEGGTEEEAE